MASTEEAPLPSASAETLNVLVVENVAESPMDATPVSPEEEAKEYAPKAPSAADRGIINPNWLSWVFLQWLDKIMLLGYKRPLEVMDLPLLNPRDQTGELSKLLIPYRDLMRQHFVDPSKPTPSLFGFLVKRLIRNWIAGAILFALSIASQVAVPTFIQQIIYYLQPEYPKEKLYIKNGVGIAFTIFALQLLFTLFGQTSTQIARTITINLRTTLIGAIYEKSLCLSNEASQKFSQGNILNLINVDTEAVAEFLLSSFTVLVTPAQVIVTLYLLHNLLGNAVWAALGTLMGSLVIQIFVFAFIAGVQKTLLKTSDNRLKVIREMLYAIRVIKFRAWEHVFETRVGDLRAKQMKSLKAFNAILIVFVCMAQLTPILMPIVAFIAYSRISGDNGLNPAVIFPALALFQLLIGPLFILPTVFSSLIRSIVSWKRISSFLSATESEPLQISSHDSDDSGKKSNRSAIEIVDATFRWQRVKEEEMTKKEAEKEKELKEQREKDAETSSSSSNLAAGYGDSEKEKLKAEDDSKTTSAVADVRVEDSSSVEKKDQKEQKKGWFGGKRKEEEELPPLEPFIKNMSLEIPAGKLTCVVGPVGAGKSSLLNAIIGEMSRVSGSVSLHGRIAYVPQQPWILTDTVEGNIVFGTLLDIDKERLSRAVHVSALGPDLERLSAGINTQIGEKGVNLSGGQKARVSLARAVYDDADIYLLDDPISALDAHVGQTVFQECVLDELKHKTRILVTHQLHLLPMTDLVVVMDQGSVAEVGSYQELIGQEGSKLSVLMKDYQQQKVDNDGLDEVKEKKVVKTNVEKKEKKEEDDKDDKFLEDEERAKGSLKMAVWLSFYRAAGGLPIVLAILLAALLQQGLGLTTSLWLVWWSNDRFSFEQNTYLKWYGVLGGSQAVAMISLNALVVIAGFIASMYYHKAAMVRLLRAPISFFESQPIGRILNRFSKDIEAVDQKLWVFYFFVIFSGGNLLSTFVLVVPLLVIYYFILRFYRATIREVKRLDSNERSPLYAHISETLSGISSVRAFKVEEKFIAKQRRLLDFSNSPSYLYSCTSIWVSIRIEFIASLIILSIGLLGATGTVDPALIGLTLSYALNVVEDIGFLLKSLANLESEMNAVERLDNYSMALPQEAPDSLPSDPKPNAWPSKGHISIKNLEVRYPSRPQHPVLIDLNLDIRPGEKIGVVGRTGSGKSTLLTTLFRLVEPSAGTIEIDGVDVSRLGLTLLRSSIGIITQEPVLFSGTVRSNLDVEQKFRDDELWEVLEMTGMKNYVSGLSKKLDDPIGENGENLSVGQRQLMCLSRAILYRSRILLLDEATASVDQAADALIQESIRTHFKSATVVSIAHRLNTVVGLDRVLVLHDGRAVEFDEPGVLLDDENSELRKLAKVTGEANLQLLREIAAKK
ncbi:hypothetical protein HDU97_009686 [Phlyctochytrium planicorne]|nr:hypothetical protein HDU97_009686 [Phlyctochytrium planicorne]